MNRLTIGRRIAIAFAATVVVLFSIDTTMACRFLWRSHRCSHAPVVYYYRPAACEVVTHHSCGSPAVPRQPMKVAPAPPAPPAPPSVPHEETMDAPPPPVDVLEAPDEGEPALTDEPDDLFDLPPNDLAPPADDGFDLPSDDDTTLPEADEPDTALPSDDDLDNFFDDPPADDPDGALPEVIEDEADPLNVPLPGDEPADDGFDLPAEDTDDSLENLFDDTTEPASDGAEPRVADNSEEDEPTADDLLEDLEGLGVDTETDPDAADDLLPTDDTAPDDLFPEDAGDAVPDDLFPEDADDDATQDLFPEEADALPADDGEEQADDLDNLFGGPGESPPRTAANSVDKTKTAAVKIPTVAIRVWVDNTGRYKTVAKLVKIGDSHIRLLKDNGRHTTVPKRRLSENDLAYVQQMSKHMGVELLDRVVRR